MHHSRTYFLLVKMFWTFCFVKIYYEFSFFFISSLTIRKYVFRYIFSPFLIITSIKLLNFKSIYIMVNKVMTFILKLNACSIFDRISWNHIFFIRTPQNEIKIKYDSNFLCHTKKLIVLYLNYYLFINFFGHASYFPPSFLSSRINILSYKFHFPEFVTKLLINFVVAIFDYY